MNEPLKNDLNEAYGVFKEDHDGLRDALLGALPEVPSRSERTARPVRPHRIIGGTTMNNRITKISIAAAAVIAVLAGTYYFTGSFDGTGIAWADVARNMETIDSYICRITSWQKPVQTSGGAASAEEKVMQLWYSNEYGFKMEQHRDGEPTLTVCMLRESDEGIRIWPQKKSYIRVKLSDEDRAIIGAQEQDPREWVRGFLTADYKSLGRDVIDGVTVEGVEINDMAVTRRTSDPSVTDYAARLWIDVESQLPVRMEEEYTLGSVRSGGATDQFEWNPDLTTADLEPDIPADYINRAEQPAEQN